jgi:hypothetical protein
LENSLQLTSLQKALDGRVKDKAAAAKSLEKDLTIVNPLRTGVPSSGEQTSEQLEAEREIALPILIKEGNKPQDKDSEKDPNALDKEKTDLFENLINQGINLG